MRLFFIAVFTFSNFIAAQNPNQKITELHMVIDSLQAKIDLLNLDVDEDGVSDYFDKCPDTPTGARIDGSGCALDTDWDGIIDLYDDCVTEPGEASNKGCPIGIINCSPTNIEFEYRSSNLSESSKAAIDAFSREMAFSKKRLNIEIIGSSTDYKTNGKNLDLSMVRAQKVYEFLIEKFPNSKHNFEINGSADENMLYPECYKSNYCKKRKEEWKNRANNNVQILINR